MVIKVTKTRNRKKLTVIVLCAFLLNTIAGPVAPAFAQSALPLPGTMVTLSPGYTPTLIKGMRVYPDNPLRFDFIVDPGDSGLQGEEFKDESTKLIRYFLSSLTVPDKDMWVNLSPTEKDRIIPDAFGKTEMGRDMLGQDYVLKQLTASLIYPESDLGKSFWTMAYQKANEVLGSQNDAINTLHKIWIMPQKAVVYHKDNIAYVVESHLKVMMEEDYIKIITPPSPLFIKEGEKSVTQVSPSLDKEGPACRQVGLAGSSEIAAVFRSVILPQIEKEVNEGENFAPLRQVYNSLILATWFKRNLKNSILGKVYVGKNKINGVDFADATDKEKIYNDYLTAFKKGVYNYIKEEEDPGTHEMIPRKYFSGGVLTINMPEVLEATSTLPARDPSQSSSSALFAVELGRAGSPAVEASSKGSSSVGSFSVRDIRQPDPRMVLLKGRLKFTAGTVPGVNSPKAILDLPPLDTQDIFAFRQSLVLLSGDPYTVLSTIMPFVNSLRSLYRENFSFRRAIGEQNAGYIEYLYQSFLNNPSLASIENAGNLIRQFKGMVRNLSDDAIKEMIETGLRNIGHFLEWKSTDNPDWEHTEISISLNAPDTMTFSRIDGGYYLEINLIDFISSPYSFNPFNQVLSWDFFMNADFPGAEIRSAIETSSNPFIRDNPKVIAEILRILAIMRLYVDPMNGVGLIARAPNPNLLQRLLANLRSDPRNRHLIRLLNQMTSLYSYQETPQGAKRLADLPRRVEAILRFIQNNSRRLADQAALQGPYTFTEIAAIAELFRTNNNLGTVFPGETSSPKPAQANAAETMPETAPQVSMVTREIYEQGILSQEERSDDPDYIPDKVYVKGPEKGPGESDGARETSVRPAMQREEELIITIPLDQSDKKYIDKIEPGIQAMREATDERTRTTVFFDQVWSEFLISRAEGWTSNNVDQKVEKAIALLDQSLGKLLRDLIQLSKDPVNNAVAIEKIAGQIRNNTFLTDHNIYIHTQVLTRKNNLRRIVTALSMIAFNIDGVIERVIDGQRTAVRILGDRLDRLNQKVQGLGFMYSGDAHGVVVKSAVRQSLNYNVIPALNNASYTTSDPEGIDPMYANERKAIQKDGHPLHPTQEQRETIYAKGERSTAKHEGQHLADQANNLHAQYARSPFIQKRIAQEINAYLASIADEDENGHPNMPFTDLVSVAQLYRSLNSNFFAALADRYNIYTDATANILLMFANYFGIEMTIEDLRQMPRTNINKIYEAALTLTPEQLIDAAKKLLEQAKSDQKKGKKYTFAKPQTAPAKPQAPPGDTSDEIPGFFAPGKNKAYTLIRAVAIGLSIVFINPVNHTTPKNGQVATAVKGKQGAGKDTKAEGVQKAEKGTPATKGEQNPDIVAPKDEKEPKVIALTEAANPAINSMKPSGEISDFVASFEVRAPQYLTNLAYMFYGRLNGGIRGAMKIYGANIEKLASLDNVPVGMELTIPDAAIEFYTIKETDTAQSIALEYYENQYQWPRIRAANPEAFIKGERNLSPGTRLMIPMSKLEKQHWDRRHPPESGPKKVSSSSEVGGINLDTQGLVIDEQGEGFNFDVPIDPNILNNLEMEPVNGFVPVILNVVPIGDLPKFLGAKTEEPKPSEMS